MEIIKSQIICEVADMFSENTSHCVLNIHDVTLQYTKTDRYRDFSNSDFWACWFQALERGIFIVVMFVSNSLSNLRIAC